MIKELDQIAIADIGAFGIVKYILLTVLLTLLIATVITFISTFVLMKGSVREQIGGGD